MRGLTVMDAINIIQYGTGVRIRGFNTTVSGSTGARKIEQLRTDIRNAGLDGGIVTTIVPLWKAMEVYIECIPM